MNQLKPKRKSMYNTHYHNCYKSFIKSVVPIKGKGHEGNTNYLLLGVGASTTQVTSISPRIF